MANLKPRIEPYNYETVINGAGKVLSQNRPMEIFRILLAQLKFLSEAEVNGRLFISGVV